MTWTDTLHVFLNE
ncbi:hypothetical protein ID866_12198 [Astraeus odoratus]|nr:hypothetical protein ID866_12198 [Astraeus odoratus]